MVHKGDMKIISQMLRNIERKNGTVELKAPLVVAPPTYNIVNELKEEGDWAVLQKYSGFEFDDTNPNGCQNKISKYYVPREAWMQPMYGEPRKGEKGRYGNGYFYSTFPRTCCCGQ